MKCYACPNPVEYSCKCLTPNIFICSSHLKLHMSDKTKKHTLETFENLEEMILFNEIREKITKAFNQIILESANKMKKIKEDALDSIRIINGLANALYQEHLGKTLNERFLEEIINCCNNENDQRKMRIYILGERISNSEESLIPEFSGTISPSQLFDIEKKASSMIKSNDHTFLIVGSREGFIQKVNIRTGDILLSTQLELNSI